MRLDATTFPIVWMRDHDDGATHDTAADVEALLALLAQGERFVMIAERLPGPSDMAREDAADRRERALLFKKTKADFARLCAGFVLIGRAASLPLPIRKAIEGMTRALGIATVFAEDEAAALGIARERLEA